MKKRSLVLLLGVCLIATAIFSSCGKTEASESPAIENTAKIDIEKPISYGSGIYYFKCEGQVFPASLAVFLSKDTTLEVVDDVPDVDDNGGLRGYTVITRKK